MFVWSSHLLVFFQLLFSALVSAGGDELYVTAYPNGDPCPHSVVKICHNLSYYLREKDDFFRDDTTFNFLQGVHQLQSNQTFLMENLTNVSFVGLGDIVVGSDKLVTQSTSVLKCSSEQEATESEGIKFVNCVDITIRRIMLTECNHSSALLINASTNVDLLNLSILNSTGYGLHMINSNNVSIVSSVITNCTTGVRITFNNISPTQLKDKQEFNFNIESINITQNDGNGLEVEFSQKKYTVNFQMESCYFEKNFVNFALLSLSCKYVLQVRSLLSKHAFQNALALSLNQSSLCQNNSMPVISLSNSVFSSSRGLGTVNVTLVPGESTTGILSIASSVFFKNAGESGILQVIYSVGAEALYNQHRSNFKVNVTDTIFIENEGNVINSERTCANNFVNIESITMTNCTFANNSITAIRIVNSVVKFEGENVFTNNKASVINGGALSIIGNSYITFNENSCLLFANNQAGMFGGAIYIDGQSLITNSNAYFCFYQPLNTTPIERNIFVFVNNSAGITGTAVYGEHVEKCYFFAGSLYVPDTKFFLGISSFAQYDDTVISSSPQIVCFCDNNGTKECSIFQKNYNVYPGETIQFSIVAVGSNDGSTPGTIRIDNFHISSYQRRLEILPSTNCTVINYKVISDIPKVYNHQYLFITVDDKNDASILILIKVADCEKGFYLSSRTNSCDCVEVIYSSHSATCYPSKQMIERSNKIYVGYNDLQNCTIVSSSCPFDYCNSKSINITLDNSYRQCSGNRVGQLCGSCSENYSLILGSNACKDCRGKQGFLFLILPFAMAGIALVFLLFLFNLTVSAGTINGLVFFANIEKIYEPFLSLESSIPFLSQFIAWINLDLGIETCFFDGMSAVLKVVLQFVFPLYVWLIITMIIVASKYSSRLANYIGNNGIPVLATLILLSYTKLINVVIIILSRVIVKCGDSFTVYWFVDPTQEYLTGRHTVLFVIAMVVMVLFIVPYTLFLLLYPLQGLLSGRCRQRISWAILKLKPFFDAYAGPYTDVFSIWPGILLVARIVLALVVSQTEDETISFSILIPLLIVIVSTLSSRSIYKNKYLHLVDASYIVALLLLSYLKIVVTNDETTISYYCNTIVLSLSFIMFCGTFLFHMCKYSAIGKACHDRMNKVDMPPLAIQRNSGYNSIEYREPLLHTSTN